MKSADHREKLEQLEHRLEEIRSDLAPAQDRLESLREQHGKAIARGDGKKAVESLKAQIREVGDEIDGYRRAEPLLVEAIRGARKDLEKAEREEAAARSSELIDEGLEAVEALHEKLVEVVEEEILPLADRAKIATSDAWGAEREAANLAGERPPSMSRVIRDGWWTHTGLQQLVEAFHHYLAGGPKAYRMQQKAEREERKVEA